MNFHPILVHFPIAILTLYAVVEILSIIFRKLKERTFNFKAALVIIGALASYVTILTGEEAAELVSDSSIWPLIAKHATWAETSAWIFATLALGYLLALILNNPKWRFWLEIKARWFVDLAKLISKIILYPVLRLILALGGLLAITITGALGGAIVYGPNIDPVVKIIYNFFF